MTWTFCPGRIPRALRTRRGMTTWNFVETVLVSIQTSYRTASRITAPFYQEAPSGSRGGWAPNGLEMGRQATLISLLISFALILVVGQAVPRLVGVHWPEAKGSAF